MSKLSVRLLIEEILKLIPNDYYKKKDIAARFEYIKQDSFYRAPECMYLCVDDIYATMRIFVLNFYKGSAKPDWVDNVVMKILEWQETYLQE